MDKEVSSFVCEACEAMPAVTNGACEEESQPYRLCVDCRHRLDRRSLRPLEWYRLALRHCPHDFLLHDDFYSDDGTAHQPDEEVVDSELFPAPTLEDCARNLSDLWDFTLTRHALAEDIFFAWNKFPKAEMLSLLTKSYELGGNCHRRSTVLTLAQNCLGLVGADLVRRAWLDYPDKMYFGALAKASVACLPADEGFERCLSVFNTFQLKKQRSQMMYMGGFKNPRMLDWIESNLQPPVTDDWGKLAARSGMSWDRAKSWLQLGRPMSLVALDSLIGVAKAAESGRLWMHVPVRGLPQFDEFERQLREYELIDSAPRVQNSVEYLLQSFGFLGELGC